jgi:hypothetical protein
MNKDITKKDILQILQEAYKLGIAEHTKYYDEARRAEYVYDRMMERLFGQKIESWKINSDYYINDTLPF